MTGRKNTKPKKRVAKKQTSRWKKNWKPKYPKPKKGEAVPWGVMPREPGQRLHWLMKSEPSVFSIDDLRAKPESTSSWDGVRNFTARNFMMQMKLGDLVLFYHSSDEPVGVAGIAEVVRESHPDLTAQDPKSEYHDPKATPEKPKWFMVDVKFVEKFEQLLPLSELRGRPALKKMIALRPGNRLSVTPLSESEYAAIVELARTPR